MKNTIASHIVRFFFLIFLQVLVLNNIQLSQYINPYLYILFIMLLPFDTPRGILLITAFLLGMGVDLFSNTIGMHASATVFMAYCRPYVLKMVSPTGEFEPDETPTLEYFNISWILTYSLIIVTLHHLFLFYVEVFGFSNFWQTLGRAIVSIVFTVILVVISHYLVYKPRK